MNKSLDKVNGGLSLETNGVEVEGNLRLVEENKEVRNNHYDEEYTKETKTITVHKSIF